MELANIVGVTGTAILILAYFLLASEKLKGDSYLYLYLNAIAATLILYSLFFHFNLASFIIEIFWIAISIYGIWKKKKRHKPLKNND